MYCNLIHIYYLTSQSVVYTVFAAIKKTGREVLSGMGTFIPGNVEIEDLRKSLLGH